MTTFFPLELAATSSVLRNALFCVARWAATPLASPACDAQSGSRYFREQRRRVLAIAPDVEVEETVLGLGIACGDRTLSLPGSPSDDSIDHAAG